jgi:hypothetical protein
MWNELAGTSWFGNGWIGNGWIGIMVGRQSLDDWNLTMME